MFNNNENYNINNDGNSSSNINNEDTNFKISIILIIFVAILIVAFVIYPLILKKNTFTATFDGNGTNKNLSEHCTTKQDSCIINTPSITRDGYEILGWSTNKDDKSAEIKINQEIELNKNITYYAITKKTLHGNFSIQDNININIEGGVTTCDIYNNEISCNIQTPKLIAKDGYTSLGWSLNPDSDVASVGNEENLLIDNDINYYSISKQTNPITASFVIQDTNAGTTSAENVSCHIYNGKESCNIEVPKLIVNEGYTAIGWNTNKDATDANVKSGDQISISDNITYNSITSQVITITFDKNTTFDNNTVGPNVSGYSYAKTNIAATSLSFYTKQCISYNGNGCYIDEAPQIISVGNEIKGFSSSKDGNILNHLLTKYKKNRTLYARIYNSVTHNNFQGTYVKTIRTVPIEVENNISSSDYNIYISYLDQMAKDLPQLFDCHEKIWIVSDEFYQRVLNNDGDRNTAGACVRDGIFGHIIVNVKGKSSDAVKGILIHEIGHAFDVYYRAKTNNFMSSKNDVTSLYNYYLNQSNRPMSDYSYKSQREFVADSIRWYYAEEFQRFDNAQSNRNPATPEIKNIVKKYLCIANNNFNENVNC